MRLLWSERIRLGSILKTGVDRDLLHRETEEIRKNIRLSHNYKEAIKLKTIKPSCEPYRSLLGAMARPVGNPLCRLGAATVVNPRPARSYPRPHGRLRGSTQRVCMRPNHRQRLRSGLLLLCPVSG